MHTLLTFLVVIAVYAITSYSVQRIADKLQTPNSWWAWIPIANVFLFLQMAQKPMWWFILFLIPIVNIVVAILLMMKICERMGRPSWWGILSIIPVVSIVILVYLAFSENMPASPVVSVMPDNTLPPQ